MKLVKVTKINQVTENTVDLSNYYTKTQTDALIPEVPDALADLSEDTTHRVVTDTEKTTWNGKSNLALGETETTAYRGDRGKTAYDYSQVGHLTKPLTGVDGTSSIVDGDMIYVYKGDTEDWRLIPYLDLLGTIQRDLGL